LASVAQAWADGLDIDWRPAFDSARVVDLPTYAFQRRRYWLTTANGARGETQGHPLGATVTLLADTNGVLLTASLSRQEHGWLADHAVSGSVLLPGTALVELALQAGDAIGCTRLEELVLQTPLHLPAHSRVDLQVVVRAPEEDATMAPRRELRPIAVYSRPADAADFPWTCHATGLLAVPIASGQDTEPFGQGLWPPSGSRPLDVADLYSNLNALGYAYGSTFRGLTAAWKHGDEVFAEIALHPEQHAEAARYGVHPILLDMALHSALLDRLDGEFARPMLPFELVGVELFATGASSARVRLSRTGSETVRVEVADPTGILVARIESITLREMSAEQDRGWGARRGGLFRIDWDLAPTDGRAIRGGTEPTEEVVIIGGAQDLSTLPDPVAATVVVSVTESGDNPYGAVVQALDLVQRWLADDRFDGSRLVFALVSDDPASAAVAGFVRSTQAEHPDRFGLLHAVDALADAVAVSAAVAGEPEIRVRNGAATVPRLARLGPTRLLPDGPYEHWHVGVTRKGTLDNLTALASPEATRALRDGEVRVRVCAAGMNFRDVVVALDMVPGLEGIGHEGAGVVVEAGPGVTGLKPGDRVMGLLPDAMGPVAIGDVRTLVPLPEGWTFVQGASVPVVFLTAWMSLAGLARLEPGQKVLVHAATGGLGLAALQVARHLGAEVFATASPAKQHLLRRLGLNDSHIASTRDLDFRDRFLAATGGHGVNVVINALTQEFTDASLDLLPEGGWFVEMGKTDLRDPGIIANEHPGVIYRHFDLKAEDPDNIRPALRRVTDLLREGVLQPPLVTTRPIVQAPEAFDLMQRAGHLGKLVLTLPSGWDPDRTVLITGGTGTLGGLLARHLASRHGVRHLLLVSRQGPSAPNAAELAADLERLGARVSIEQCAVENRESVRALLDEIPADRPLGAVIHAAGVLSDALVEDMSPEQVADVMRAKTDGAMHLDELTAGMDLSVFVLFSSIAGTVGTPGQANYAAANAALDALAHSRRSRGLPAVSLAWGLWEEVSGLTGHLDGRAIDRLGRSGTGVLASHDGLSLFDAALEWDEPTLVAARLDTSGLREQAAVGEVPTVLRNLAGAPRRLATHPAAQAAGATGGPDVGTGAGKRDKGSLRERLVGASPEESRRILLDLIRSHAAAVLRFSGADEVDPGRTFREMGFDSLTAVELRNRLNSATGLRLPSTVAFWHPTPHELAARLYSELFADEQPGSVSTVAYALERLRSSLTDLGPDDAMRIEAADRLRALLQEVTGATAETEELTNEELVSATDDEVFALIDKELGIE
jgi:NADPH:quinone reductase-like Zn-dependent oxidoreductase